MSDPNRDGLPDVLLATDAEWRDLMDDDRQLLRALAERGIRGRPAVWNDPSVDWSSARMVVLRSVFDYVRDRDAFCAWVDRVAALTTFHNPSRLVRWNSHKSYLRDLEASGVPIVETAWLEAGRAVDIAGLLAERGWSDAVVKPAVGNGARGATRIAQTDLSHVQEHVDAALSAGDLMVQPYVEATETLGEHKLIHLGGRFSHAITEDPRLGGRAFSMDLVTVVDPDPRERELAERILSLIPESPLLYARVDTIVDGDVARLMELEVIEPVLFLSKSSSAADRLAEEIEERLASR